MAEDQTFGYGEEFQKNIVSAALKDPTFLLHYDDVLLPGYLDYDYLSSILRIGRELTERLGEVPTKLTVVEEAKEFCNQFNLSTDDREFILNKLEEVYAMEKYDLPYIQDKVLNFGRRQSLRSAVMKVITIVNSDTGKDGDPYDRAWQVLEDAKVIGLGTRDMGLDLYPNLLEIPRLAATSSAGSSRKVPTLIPTLDKKTMGGPGRGEVWIIMGLPGRGKSAMLVNIGAGALKSGFAVVHITIGDLDKIDVAIRYAARLTMSSCYEVITGAESYMRKAAAMAQYNPHLNIKEYTSGSATMAHVRAYVSKLRAVEEFSPAVIIVDYPEELRQTKDDLYAAGGDNYTAMRAMAKDFDCVVWAASQVQRWRPDHPNDVIKMDNIAESWKKPQKADGVMSWNMSYEEELVGRARLWIDKTRRAKSYYLIHMEADMERMLIKEGKPPKSAEDEDD